MRPEPVHHGEFVSNDSISCADDLDEVPPCEKDNVEERIHLSAIEYVRRSRAEIELRNERIITRCEHFINYKSITQNLIAHDAIEHFLADDYLQKTSKE